MKPEVKAFFDEETFTLTYVVWDHTTLDAVVIDPVLNYDPKASTYSFESNDEVFEFIKAKSLKPHLIMETHAHADHLTGGQDLKARFPGSKVAIGEKITSVQDVFKGLFNFGEDHTTDGSDFDLLLKAGEVVSAGSLKIKVLPTPGHTPGCVSYLIGDAVFTGDVIFMPDYGTGRCDFPGGDAKSLFKSVTSQLFTLPEETRVFVGHDYQPGGRPVKWESSISEEKKENIQLGEKTTESEFVGFRTKRDKQLTAPRLLFQSVQFNAWGGHLPKPEKNNVSYLKMPLKKRD